MNGIDRRTFLKSLSAGATALAWTGCRTTDPHADEPVGPRPNIVLCMTDDQGWGDVGYNGHEILSTPVLDDMASMSLRFDRFYAAAPVGSPTRASVLTGRHPNRYGCFQWGFSIRPGERTLPQVLREAGYATGHFGKWHLGPAKAGSAVSPGACGFDEWLSHDSHFDLNPRLSRNGEPPAEFQGESSEIVVREALTFMRDVREAGMPFFVVVWFGSPHSPQRATPEDCAAYRDLPERQQHYLGELAAVDRAMGQLRDGLRGLRVVDDTMLWFCSDNGAAALGSTGGLRGRKGSLWEGGIRVPGFVHWPIAIPHARVTAVPCSTLDIYPTVLGALQLTVPNPVAPRDGISLVPLLENRSSERPEPMPFWCYPFEQETGNESWLPAGDLKGYWRTFRNFRHPEPRESDFAGPAALIDNRHKLVMDRGGAQLFDVVADPTETTDLAGKDPERIAAMADTLRTWQQSVERSLSGRDYLAPVPVPE